MKWIDLLKNLCHVMAIAAATTVATQVQNGPLTSGHVLLPAAGAVGSAIVGAILKQYAANVATN